MKEGIKMNKRMKPSVLVSGLCILAVAACVGAIVYAQQGKVVSSYGPTNQDMTFEQIKAARVAVKAGLAKEHMNLLNSRYDLSKKTTTEVTMSAGKPIPLGHRAKGQGRTWEHLRK